MARIRRKRRKLLRGGSNEPEFAAKQGGNKQVSTQFDHVEGPSNRESVTQQQAGAQQDAEMQMAMNQTGGNKETGSEDVSVPQSNAASKDGNEAMAQSAGMLMQSRQNAPANQASANDTVKTGGTRRKRKTRKGKNKKRRKSTKKKRSKRRKKRRTKRKYKFARKYHQKGCSRRSCKKH